MALNRKSFIDGELLTPSDELEIMAGFKDKPEFQVIKSWVNRYIQNLKTSAFKLNMSKDSHRYIHAGYVDQALALKMLIFAIESSSKELAKRKGEEESEKRKNE